MKRTLSLVLLVALFLVGCAPAATPTAAPTQPPATAAPTTVLDGYRRTTHRDIRAKDTQRIRCGLIHRCVH